VQAPTEEDVSEQRVQKLIAQAGICSRRHAEDLIRDGRVRVNGAVIELGAKADPARDHIKVDGKLLPRAETLRHLLMYKPREIMTTCDDPEERTTVIDLVPKDVTERVFPVGRLDYHSEGLLILTNDGELAARITHPRYGIVREYLVKIRGDLDERSIAGLLKGTVVDGRRVVPKSLRPEGTTRSGANTWWRVEIVEGRTHEVRQLFFRAGKHVQRLRRSAIGPVRDEALRPGEVRELTKDEVRRLRAATRSASGTPGHGRQRRGARKTGGRPGRDRTRARKS
jgi:23S rRNA pseudouridine2605 synthase